MTYPHQMNCSHSDDGWCLNCVDKLGTELIELERGFEALEKWQYYFGFARLYQCGGGWYVSNKTDEGIGGADPEIKAYGVTPKEALIAAARFLEDPKIPSDIPCPGCGKIMKVHSYTYNGCSRTDIEFFCWGLGDNCGMVLAEDICPRCGGYLDFETDETYDRNTDKWDVVCQKCGEKFSRGNDVDLEVADLKFEKIDLEAFGDDDVE